MPAPITGTRDLPIKDVDIDADEESPYECFECGEIVAAQSAPVQCPECGGDMRNRRTPIE